MAIDQLQFAYAKANLGIAIAFACFALLAVALRFNARRVSGAKYGWDDFVIVIALVLCLGLCIMAAWAAVHGGLGVPQQDLTEDRAVAYLKQTWAQEMLFVPAVGTVKISVCLFYKRIFRIEKTFRLAVNVMLALVVAWTIAFQLCTLFSYWPISLQWSLARKKKHTLNFSHLIIAMAATDLFLDVLILSLPVPMIRKLKLPSRKKWMLGGMFGLGAFCVVASAARLTFTVLFLSEYITDANNAFTRDENQIAIWSNIEPCASVACACLPTFGPYFPSSSPSSSSSSSWLASNTLVSRVRLWSTQFSARTLFRSSQNSRSTGVSQDTRSFRPLSHNVGNGNHQHDAVELSPRDGDDRHKKDAVVTTTRPRSDNSDSTV